MAAQWTTYFSERCSSTAAEVSNSGVTVSNDIEGDRR